MKFDRKEGLKSGRLLPNETPISYCQACGWSDERHVKVCPECGNTHLVHYVRRGKPKTAYIE